MRDVSAGLFAFEDVAMIKNAVAEVINISPVSFSEPKR